MGSNDDKDVVGESRLFLDWFEENEKYGKDQHRESAQLITDTKTRE